MTPDHYQKTKQYRRASPRRLAHRWSGKQRHSPQGPKGGAERPLESAAYQVLAKLWQDRAQRTGAEESTRSSRKIRGPRKGKEGGAGRRAEIPRIYVWELESGGLTVRKLTQAAGIRAHPPLHTAFARRYSFDAASLQSAAKAANSHRAIRPSGRPLGLPVGLDGMFGKICAHIGQSCSPAFRGLRLAT